MRSRLLESIEGPVHTVTQECDDCQGFLGFHQGVRERKVGVHLRIEIESSAQGFPDHRTAAVMLNLVLVEVVAAAEDAKPSTLEAGGGRPAIPNCAEHSALGPKGNQVSEEVEAPATMTCGPRWGALPRGAKQLPVSRWVMQIPSSQFVPHTGNWLLGVFRGEEGIHGFLRDFPPSLVLSYRLRCGVSLPPDIVDPSTQKIDRFKGVPNA